MMTALFRLSFLSTCALTAAFSLYLFGKEYQVAYLLRGMTNDQIDMIASSATLPEPRSARSARDLLTACGRILTLAPRISAEQDTADKVRAGCKAVSDRILKTSPTYGRARAVAVISSVPKISAADYRSARIAAPYEPWPLLIRIEAYARTAERPQELTGLAESDFASALSYQWGRDEMARLYVAHPSLRQGIRTAADRLDGDARTDFLRALRTATERAG